MKILATLALLAAFAIPVSAKDQPRKKPSQERTLEQLTKGDDEASERFERETKACNLIAEAMKVDKHRPNKADVSGCWSTGPNLVGISFQLEQVGEKVTGRGYNWGCAGAYSPFTIRGTYRGDRLVIRITEESGRYYTLRMTYAEEDNYPRFKSTAKNSWSYIQTTYESEERSLAEQEKQP